MRFEKQITISAPREKVWQFIWNVDRFIACVPGCKEASTVEEGKIYTATMEEKIGPFRVKFPMKVEVENSEPLTSIKARASGSDSKLGSLMKGFGNSFAGKMLQNPAGQAFVGTFGKDALLKGKIDGNTVRDFTFNTGFNILGKGTSKDFDCIARDLKVNTGLAGVEMLKNISIGEGTQLLDVGREVKFLDFEIDVWPF